MLLDPQDKLILRLLDGEPLEYILGESYFFTSRFYVNENVLIPRSETEILVEDALDLIGKRSYESFADIGTGSGCIAISILTESKRPLKAFASDISPLALKVCETNLFRHRGRLGKGRHLNLLLGDRFEPLDEKVDLIVSNPPYIDWDEDRKDVHFQTDLHEPKLALYLGGGQYEEWFEEFFKSAYDMLNPGGALLMEGHESKLQGLKSMAQKRFTQVEVKQDYTRTDRFLRAFKEE